MSSPLPSSPVEHSTPELEYQPVSGVAVAAIVVASAFVLIGTVTSLISVWNKRPALNTWILGLAGLGLALAVAARIHIRQSEGTRSGARLASIAWWMCVLGGVMLGAYIYASTFVLRQQSEKTVQEFFELLKKADVNQAFVLTVPSSQRPKSEREFEGRFGSNQFPAFRDSELVRYFIRNGDEVSYKSLGISHWQQIEIGYRVEVAYRLTSAEGIHELNLALTGMEGPDLIGRVWFLGLEGGLIVKNRTPFGRLIHELQDEASRDLGDWMNMMIVGNRENAYLKTLPPADRAEPTGVLQAKLLAGSPMITFLPTGLSSIPAERRKSIGSRPGNAVFNELLARDFFVHTGEKFLTEEKKSHFARAWSLGLFMPTGGSRLLNLEKMPRIRVTPDEIACRFPIEIGVPLVKFDYFKVWVEVVSTNPALLREVQDLKAKCLKNPELADETPAALLPKLAARDWQIRRLETTFEALQPAPKQPGG